MIVLNTTYFGSVDWYRQIACAEDDVVYIEAHEHYVKQTERNRCVIATANGTQNLSVPVTVPSPKCSVSEVLISDHGNWRHNHWEALKTAYGMSPFFDFYQDDIRPFFEFGSNELGSFAPSTPPPTTQVSPPPTQTLFDHNMAIATKILDLIGIHKTLLPTDSYQGLTEWNQLSPHQEGHGVGRYYQTFQRRHGFIPHLSILDLLFNEGPEAIFKLIDV